MGHSFLLDCGRHSALLLDDPLCRLLVDDVTAGHEHHGAQDDGDGGKWINNDAGGRGGWMR